MAEFRWRFESHQRQAAPWTLGGMSPLTFARSWGWVPPQTVFAGCTLLFYDRGTIFAQPAFSLFYTMFASGKFLRPFGFRAITFF